MIDGATPTIKVARVCLCHGRAFLVPAYPRGTHERQPSGSNRWRRDGFDLRHPRRCLRRVKRHLHPAGSREPPRVPSHGEGRRLRPPSPARTAAKIVASCRWLATPLGGRLAAPQGRVEIRAYAEPSEIRQEADWSETTRVTSVATWQPTVLGSICLFCFASLGAMRDDQGLGLSKSSRTG